MKASVSVLGAGIVGICCALELQSRGFRVSLIDRRGPGEETSSGNAGILSYGDITPIADPALWLRLHRMVFNLEPDFRLHYPHLASLLPWLLAFLGRCRRRTFLQDGAEMSRLTLASIDAHRRWIDAAGLQPLLNRGGVLKLYRKPESYRRASLERELWQQCGIGHTALDADEVYRLEPDLKQVFVQGLLVGDSISIRDPEKLCKAYARLFTQAGGVIERAEVRALQPRSGGWALTTDSGVRETDKVVVCLGAWSPQLLAPLGYTDPVAIERGYHVMLLPLPERRLTRPIFDVDAGYVMAPMEAGLRVTTGTNLVARETRPDLRQIERVLPRVHEAFPLDDIVGDAWTGRRPTVPDTLPLIGPAPRHRHLWLAFAHSHMGLTLGPISGELIANFIEGLQQPFSVRACDPGRYL